MARVVVVASSEVPREALAEVITADDDVRVVIPAVEQSRLQWLANDDDGARAEAQDVGQAVAEAAPVEPSRVDVKPDPPDQVLLGAIAEHRPELVVLATRDGERATWLEKDESGSLPSEIGGVPVVRITV